MFSQFKKRGFKLMVTLGVEGRRGGSKVLGVVFREDSHFKLGRQRKT